VHQSFDETTTPEDVDALFGAMNGGEGARLFRPRSPAPARESLPQRARAHVPPHPVFNAYHSEHEMVRYLARLEQKDLSARALDDRRSARAR
jgi:glycine dehydrogenase